MITFKFGAFPTDAKSIGSKSELKLEDVENFSNSEILIFFIYKPF